MIYLCLTLVIIYLDILSQTKTVHNTSTESSSCWCFWQGITTFCSLALNFNYWAITVLMFIVEMFCVVDQKLKENLSKEFSDLVIYCKNVHFNSFEHSQTHSKPYKMSSFSESKARKLIKEAGRFKYIYTYLK